LNPFGVCCEGCNLLCDLRNASKDRPEAEVEQYDGSDGCDPNPYTGDYVLRTRWPQCDWWLRDRAKPGAKGDQKHNINLQSHNLSDGRSPSVAKQCMENEVTDCSDDCSGEHAATERYQELVAPDEWLDLIWSGRDHG
jgi:hypothetical protein